MNLFELNKAFKELSERDDLDLETLNDTLESIELDRETKLDNLATWHDRNKADIDFIKERIKELQDAKKALENKNKSIMNYITSALDDAGIQNLRTEHHLLSTRNYKKPLIIDETKLDKKYYKTELIEKTSIDKDLIRELLVDGETINGAYLADNRKAVIK